MEAGGPTLIKLKVLCNSYKVRLPVIIEPTVATSKRLSFFQLSLGFQSAVSNEKGNIRVMPGNEISFYVVDSFDQAISIAIWFSDLPEEMIVFIVHGSNSKRKRRILWDMLLQFQSSSSLPWL